MPKKVCALSLIELLISMILMALILLGFFSIDLFSRHHVVSSDRRAKVQNEISYAIEYMSKYVQMSTGGGNYPPIKRYPATGVQTGFQVNVDLNNTQTAGDFTDDTWVTFYLEGAALKTSAEANPLSDEIVGVFDASAMPEFPDKGFYVNITDQGTAVEIGLVGRYNPAVAADPDNPQIFMKTRLVSPSSSAQ